MVIVGDAIDDNMACSYYLGIQISECCPLDNCRVSGTAIGIIAHINDTHIVSFRFIAEWLDSLPYDLIFAGKRRISVKLKPLAVKTST